MMATIRRVARAFLDSDGVRRALWTLAQAGVGVAAVEAADAPTAYAVPIAFLLSALKSAIAKRRAEVA